jgi:hypothetical protein
VALWAVGVVTAILTAFYMPPISSRSGRVATPSPPRKGSTPRSQLVAKATSEQAASAATASADLV